MRFSVTFLSLVATTTMATPTLSPATLGISLTADTATPTILFDIDGNEARANFRVPIPGKQTANQRLLALSVQAVNNLAAGQDKMDVVCQAFSGGGEILGKPFDLRTRVVLSGDERRQVVVGAIECQMVKGGLGGRMR